MNSPEVVPREVQETAAARPRICQGHGKFGSGLL
jgi:hypothetical protein